MSTLLFGSIIVVHEISDSTKFVSFLTSWGVGRTHFSSQLRRKRLKKFEDSMVSTGTPRGLEKIKVGMTVSSTQSLVHLS